MPSIKLPHSTKIIEKHTTADIVHTVVGASKDFFASCDLGYQLVRFEYSFGKTIFYLEPFSEAICPRCNKPCRKIHDRTLREVQDMPMYHTSEQLFLRFRIRLVRCECGCHQCEQLSWLEPKDRLINTMVGWIQALLQHRLPIADVVHYCNVSSDTVKTYDKTALRISTRMPGEYLAACWEMVVDI